MRQRLEDSWARHHGNASRPALVLHPQYGLGNRMLSAISALALAVASDRRLFVAWDSQFADLFDSPFSQGWLPSTEELAGPGADVHWRRAKTLDLTAASPELSALTATLACGGVRAALGDAHIVRVSSDQYFLPLLLLHDDARARLAALLGTPPEHEAAGEVAVLEERLVRGLGRWLLRPAADVRRAVMAFEQHHLSRDQGGCAVGLHVRVPMFAFERTQVTPAPTHQPNQPRQHKQSHCTLAVHLHAHTYVPLHTHEFERRYLPLTRITLWSACKRFSIAMQQPQGECVGPGGGGRFLCRQHQTKFA